MSEVVQEIEEVIILRMSDFDGDCNYYYVPDEWYLWMQDNVWGKPMPVTAEPPVDWVEAYFAEWESTDPEDKSPTLMSWDNIGSGQIFAIEKNYIGGSLAEVITWLDGRKIREELEGQWY